MLSTALLHYNTGFFDTSMLDINVLTIAIHSRCDDVMIMEMIHCLPLPSITKLLTVSILFGSTHIWGEETVK